MSKARSFAVALLLLSFAGTALAAKAPLAVSPGDVSKLVLIEDRCPTFSWGEVEEATAYELVVYRVEEGGQEEKPVLSQRVPGSASVWTPDLALCLERGGQYAWAVRAQGKKVTSPWSVPSLFEVSLDLSEEEFEKALQVVRRYLSNERESGSERKVGANGKVESQSTREATAQSPVPAAVGTTQLSVDGGIEATFFTGDGSALKDLAPENLAAAVPIPKGGTGAATAGNARANLGAAAATHAHTEVDITDLAHIPDTVLTEGQVETFVTNGLLDGSNFTNLNASNLTTGTVAEERIADEIARDTEIFPPGGGALRLIQCVSANGWRYYDLGDGTVLDCNTGLIWLKNANCFSTRSWAQAESDAADLASGDCGLTDDSSAGDWRQPTISELCSAGAVVGTCPANNAPDSLIDSSLSGSPKVANAQGTATVSEGDAFVQVQPSLYWSATELDATNAWYVDLSIGVADSATKGSTSPYVWPVRSAEDPGQSGTVLNMLVVFDRSASMASFNWGPATSSLSDFFNDPTSAGIRAGLNFFPVDGAADQCLVTEYDPIQVPIGELTGYSPTLTNALGNQNPTGGSTPTYPALQGSLSAAIDFRDANVGQTVVVVLITDGQPNECNTSLTEIRSLVSSVWNGWGLPTYVIALAGATVADMNSIAFDGGTGQAYDISNDASLLRSSMEAIVAHALGL